MTARDAERIAPGELAAELLSRAHGETQVTVADERSLFSRFARSAPTQATGTETRTVNVLSVVEGHVGTAGATSLDREALDRALQAARASAEAAARREPGPYPGLPAPEPARGHDGWDAATARLDARAASDAVGATFAAAAEHGLEAYGVWTAGEVLTAIRSSSGLAVEDRATDVHMRVVCRDEHGRSGFAASTGRAVSALDGAALAHTAAERVAPSEPGPLEPGEYTVVLDHEAVGELLEYLAPVAFNGLAHAEGRGALSGRLGTRVAAADINLADSPRHPVTLPRAFDAEGVPKRPLPLIQDGVAHSVAHDTRTAAVAGGTARSTGHALEPGGAGAGAWPTNLVLAGGGAADSDALAAPIERGIYVNRLWYVNHVHPSSSLVTGMTRDGTCLIEDGRIAGPLRDVRFTDSVLRILSATEELGAVQRLVSGGHFYGQRSASGVVCPALRAHGFQVTGGA